MAGEKNPPRIKANEFLKNRKQSPWKLNLTLVNISIKTCILIKPNKQTPKKSLEVGIIIYLYTHKYFALFWSSVFFLALFASCPLTFFPRYSWKGFLPKTKLILYLLLICGVTSAELLFGVRSSSLICIPWLECWVWCCPITALRRVERGFLLCPACSLSSLWNWWGTSSVKGRDRWTGWLFETSVICKFAIHF